MIVTQLRPAVVTCLLSAGEGTAQSAGTSHRGGAGRRPVPQPIQQLEPQRGCRAEPVLPGGRVRPRLRRHHGICAPANGSRGASADRPPCAATGDAYLHLPAPAAAAACTLPRPHQVLTSSMLLDPSLLSSS